MIPQPAHYVAQGTFTLLQILLVWLVRLSTLYPAFNVTQQVVLRVWPALIHLRVLAWLVVGMVLSVWDVITVGVYSVIRALEMMCWAMSVWH